MRSTSPGAPSGTSVPEPVHVERVDALPVFVYADRQDMGRAAAGHVASALREAVRANGRARIVLASAPSQREFLVALAEADVDWQRVEAFHMDEYIGLPPGSPQSFAQFLLDNLFHDVEPAEFHALDGTADPGAEAGRYALLLSRAPLDVVCCGIGENAHIAFNDPGTADFDDPQAVRVVTLAEQSRRQQVNDGMFRVLDDVPTHALTLTVPALVSARLVSCVVPGPTKRSAVRRMLREPVHPDTPASVLRRQGNSVLRLDREAYDLE